MEHAMKALDSHSPAMLTGSTHRPVPLSRWAIGLAIASLALVAYIGAQRDLRLRRYALDQATIYAADLNSRVGSAGVLPLDLEPPERPPAHEARMIRLECVDRNDAWVLRRADAPVLAAHSDPLGRIFAPDGRVVVWFDAGKFSAEWLAESDYDRAATAQRERLKKLREGAP